MIIIGGSRIAEFRSKHPQSRGPLDAWYRIVSESDWGSFRELRETFGSADMVKQSKVNFNVSGNKYRLVARIDFERRLIDVLEVLTHSEYSKKRY